MRLATEWSNGFAPSDLPKGDLADCESAAEYPVSADAPSSAVSTAQTPDKREAPSVIEAWAARRAGFGRVIPLRQPVVFLGTTCVLSRANIALVSALQKSGKSALVGAILGAIAAGPHGRGDTLGFTADNASGQAVIHFDSEQSPDDHEALFATALKRAGLESPPPWLYSYGVKGLDVVELKAKLRALLVETNGLHGGILIVILDGVAEFVDDTNDPKECNLMVRELESVATQFNCNVLAILHLNPSTRGATTKTRGHLGSQLERKCETDLRLVKASDGLTTLYTACARRAPILEKDGVRFWFSQEVGMHVSVAGTTREKNDAAKAERCRTFAKGVWGSDRGLNYTPVINRIMKECTVEEKTAQEKFTTMRKLGVITKQLDLWYIAD